MCRSVSRPRTTPSRPRPRRLDPLRPAVRRTEHVPVDDLDGAWVELASLASDDKMDLNIGDWVEFADTAYLSRGEPLPLLRIEEVDLRAAACGSRASRTRPWGVAPHRIRSCAAGTGVRPCATRPEPAVRSRARRSSATARSASRKAAGCPWRTACSSMSSPAGPMGRATSGPSAAHTVTGGVERPTDAARRPLVQAPCGRHTHYAPLARVLGEGSEADLRLAFAPLSSPVPAPDAEALAADETYEAEAAAAENETAGDPGSRRAAQDEGQPEN